MERSRVLPDSTAFRAHKSLLNFGATNTAKIRSYAEEGAKMRAMLGVKEDMGAGYHPLRVAIDVSAWFYPSKMVPSEQESGGSNPIIRNAFFKCLKLVKLGIIPVFVFDSLTRRPSVKRTAMFKSAGGTHPELLEQLRRMAKLFKFPVLDAATEAEAECARLNALGIVDGVFSNDVDCLLFGGQIVLRSTLEKDADVDDGDVVRTPVKKKRRVDGKAAARRVANFVDVMSADRIESGVGMNRNRLVAAAMLAGSDYTSGISNIGTKTAFEIARTGLADSVMDAALGQDFEALSIARDDLETEIRTNRSKKLRSRRDVSLPHDFPQPDVFKAYMDPVLALDGNEALGGEIEDMCREWMEGELDVEGMRGFMRMVLKWSEETTEAKMVSLVVPALRNRRMRIEAHKRAMGLTEEMFEEVEKDAERRVEDMKKGRRSLSRSSSVVPEGKITNFFAVRKSSSFTAGLVRVKTEEGELGSPSASPFVESPVNGMMDSTLVNEVVSVRVSKEGVEMAKVRVSHELFASRILGSSTSSYESRSLSSTNPFLTNPTANDEDDEDEAVESDCEWIEASIARVIAPNAFYTFKAQYVSKYPKRRPATPSTKPSLVDLGTPQVHKPVPRKGAFQFALESITPSSTCGTPTTPKFGAQRATLEAERAFWDKPPISGEPAVMSLTPYVRDEFESDDDERGKRRWEEDDEESVLRAPRKRKVAATLEDISYKVRPESPLMGRGLDDEFEEFDGFGGMVGERGDERVRSVKALFGSPF